MKNVNVVMNTLLRKALLIVLFQQAILFIKVVAYEDLVFSGDAFPAQVVQQGLQGIQELESDKETADEDFDF